MTTSEILLAILISAGITFFLRALPFLAFSKGRQMPEVLESLGKVLPSALMAILIVYCLKDIPTDYVGIGIPKLLAVLCVGVSYKWKHNTFLSILLGTAVYMIFGRLFC